LRAAAAGPSIRGNQRGRSMKIRIATFNVENLFTRPAAMADGAGPAGQQAIDDHALLNAIVAQDAYTAQDKDELLRLDKVYRFSALNPPRTALVQLQKVRGILYSRSQAGVVSIKANGRGDWTGWFELRRSDIQWQATFNTGRVIAEVNPDILICVEAENRPTLLRFNEQVLDAEFGKGYPHVMVIDGNDERGIDLGLMSRYPIEAMRSHVDVREAGARVFSRDCPEYVILLPNGERVVVIPNHFKSKRGGNDQDAQARRLLQGTTAALIARNAEAAISRHVVVGGDLNDTPASEAVQPLLAGGWRDVGDHASYPSARPGTFNTGTAGNKIDYLILSPALWASLQATDIERRGSWHPNTWTPFDTVTSKASEASDHHMVFADLEVGA